MITNSLRFVSLVATAIIVLSFGMFVIDQSRNGANQQIAALNADAQGVRQSPTDASRNIDQANPSDAVKRERSKRHSALREKVDEADDILLKPFASIAPSKSIWVQRTVPALLALLVFGFGLRLAANYVSGRR
jgi:hypothetical protein